VHYHTCRFISERFDSNFIVASSERKVLSKCNEKDSTCDFCMQYNLPAEETFAGAFLSGRGKNCKNIRTAKIYCHTVFANKLHDFGSNIPTRLFLIAALTLTYRLKCCGTTFSTIQVQAL